MSQDEKLNGLGGWLILIGISIILSPIRIVGTYYPLFNQIFTNGTWHNLTTPGTESYIPFFAPLLIAEIIYNIGLFFVLVYLIILYFNKHYLFPKIFIVVAFVSFFMVLIDSWATALVFPGTFIFDEITIKDLVRSMLNILIWVPYMLKSKRVKSTFIKNSPSRMQNSNELSNNTANS